MNKFDETYNRYISSVYSSMCLNEYNDSDDEEETADPALDAAATAQEGSAVDRAKEKHDKQLKKVLDQKTKNLQKAGSALKKPGM